MSTRPAKEYILMGCIRCLESDSQASALPLEHTRMMAQITGPLASVSVSQSFANPFHKKIELEYLFPLPEKAAILGFELRIGERLVRGDLQEIQQAQQAYREAVDQGKKAGLLEQRRPNLFAVQIGNVQPGEQIQATLHYQERLKYDDGEYEFVFPMGITPRYHDPSHPEESAGIDPLYTGTDAGVGPVEINITVDAGLPTADPHSPSHLLQFQRLDEHRFHVTLGADAIPDHDFVMRYAVSSSQSVLTCWRAPSYFLASLLPPTLESFSGEPAPREFIFVLDRSGSMSGAPIAQARNALRACLRALSPADHFRILLFDDALEWYKNSPSPVKQKDIERVDSWLGKVEGRGGTDIILALDAVLALPASPQRQRFIVFLTDGAVSAEDRALDMVRKEVGNARIFTFGIGPAVNRAVLRRLAELGRGTAEFLQHDEDIEGAIIRFQDRVTYPVLTDLQLTWRNAKVWDVYPSRLPDLYIGQPLEIVGQLLPAADGAPGLTLHGRYGQRQVELSVDLPDDPRPEPAIEHVWASARLDEMLEHFTNPSKDRAAAIEFALQHNLVSRYTAFVAIDSQSGSQGAPVPIQVAQPLPRGLDPRGFFGALPSAAAAYRSPGAPPPVRQPSVPQPTLPTAGGQPHQALFHLPDLRSLLPAKKSRQETTAAQPESINPSDAESVLHWLARTQKLDGSWQGDVERTAAALLAFVRHGHTTRSGNYRVQVRRACEWLAQAKASGFAAFARLAALTELANVTRMDAHRQIVQQIQTRMPTPTTALEQAASAATPPAAIHTLDDLRLAALAKARLAVPAELYQGDAGELASIWAATLP